MTCMICFPNSEWRGWFLICGLVYSYSKYLQWNPIPNKQENHLPKILLLYGGRTGKKPGGQNLLGLRNRSNSLEKLCEIFFFFLKQNSGSMLVWLYRKENLFHKYTLFVLTVQVGSLKIYRAGSVIWHVNGHQAEEWRCAEKQVNYLPMISNIHTAQKFQKRCIFY